MSDSQSQRSTLADGSVDKVFDRIAQQFIEDVRLGRNPSIEDYARRHPEIADELRDLLPALAMLENAPVGLPDGGTVASQHDCPEVLGDYRIIHEVGRGGMGIVYEAEQISLGRRVAIKVLARPRDPQAVERFRREARAAANLHHTNIVPVFEVGEERETFYYAMQYIRGNGLDQLVARMRRSLGEDNETQTVDSTESVQKRPDAIAILPVEHHAVDDSTIHETRFTQGRCEVVAKLFVQVCDALEYAHRRNVIHRDIKPSNLILDGSGTVWVADFGLAKTLHGDLTESGDMLGTLRYMSPERFQGNCDARSDVYALGATLYELVTLQGAFSGGDPLELVGKIRNEEPPRPRSIDRSIPADLETIVLKSMEKQPHRRYSSAAAMGEDLARFLSDKPIQARRVSRFEHAWRWSRRNSALAAALATVALLVIAATIGLAIKNRQLAQAHKLQSEARELAEQNFELATAAVERYLEQASDDPQLRLANFESLRRRLLTTAIPFYERFTKQKPGDNRIELKRGDALYQLGQIQHELGELDAALNFYRESGDVFSRLARAHPEVDKYPRLLGHVRNARARVLNDQGQLIEAKKTFELAAAVQSELLVKDSESSEYRSDLARTESNLAALLLRLDDREGAARLFESALKAQRAVMDADPANPEYRSELARTYASLGVLRYQAQQFQTALDLLEPAQQLQMALVDEFPDNPSHQAALARTFTVLAANHFGLGDQDTALGARTEAINRFTELVNQHPQVTSCRGELAMALYNQGQSWVAVKDLTAAEKTLRSAWDHSITLLQQSPSIPEYLNQSTIVAETYSTVLSRRGNRDAAAEVLGQAIQWNNRLVESFPNVPQYLRQLAVLQRNLGVFQFQMGEYEDSRRWLDQSLSSYERLGHKKTSQDESFEASTLSVSALAAKRMKLWTEAEQAYSAALARQRHLSERSPDNPLHLVDQAITLNNLAELHRQLGRWGQAGDSHSEAKQIRQALVDQYPNEVQHRRYLHSSQMNLAVVMQQLAADDNACQSEYEAAIEGMTALVSQFPERFEYQVELANAQSNFGGFLRDLGELELSLKSLAKGIESLRAQLSERPRDENCRIFLRNAHVGRAMTLDRLQRYTHAAKDWEHAADLATGAKEQHFRLMAKFELSRAGIGDVPLELALELAESSDSGHTLVSLARILAVGFAAHPGREDLAAQAIDLLKKAKQDPVIDTPRTRRILQRDPDFTPLRSRKDFRQLWDAGPELP